MHYGSGWLLQLYRLQRQTDRKKDRANAHGALTPWSPASAVSKHGIDRRPCHLYRPGHYRRCHARSEMRPMPAKAGYG